MSGGYFNYKQDVLDELADSIQQISENKDLLYYGERFSEETLLMFWKAVVLLRTAAIYVHHIDLLLSGDNGVKAFHKRLEEDLLEYAATLEEEIK